jgi:hypothetical protein
MFRPALSATDLILLAALAGCAKPHEQIDPAPFPTAPFELASCRELALLHAKTTRALILASVAQDQRHADDRTPTFGVPTPMATIFGENDEETVARLKGQSLALIARERRAGRVAREG